MGKIKVVLLITAFLFLVPTAVLAENIAGSSAAIMTSNNRIRDEVASRLDYLKKKRTILAMSEKYNSPMSDSADAYLNTCMKYDLDCYLLPSIATLESTMGRFVWPNSYNAFGWGGGYIMFKDWAEGIDTVGRGLRLNYINKGALTIDQIGRIYSESPTWAQRVSSIKVQFEKEEEKNSLYLNNNIVKL